MSVELNRTELDIIREALMDRIHLMERLLHSQAMSLELGEIHDSHWRLLNKLTALGLENVKPLTSSY